MFFANASQSTLDRQGRVVIPPKLREHAHLKKEIIFIGISTRIEIWDKEKWDDYNNADDFNYEALTEHLQEFDL